MKRLASTLASAGIVALAAACASVGGGTGGTVTGAPDQTTGRPDVIWPMKVREHVDLWLHGYAMLQEDSTFVPFFRRGYGTTMTVLKNRANVVTQLDANRERLRSRLAANPQLINAQFIPLNFSSWDELVSVVDIFVRANGDLAETSFVEDAAYPLRIGEGERTGRQGIGRREGRQKVLHGLERRRHAGVFRR